MPDISFIVAALVQTVVTIGLCVTIYALFSRALWYQLHALNHELEVVRSQVTREVKVRAADKSHEGGKMSASVLRDVLALTQATQGVNKGMTREDIIEQGRRGS